MRILLLLAGTLFLNACSSTGPSSHFHHAHASGTYERAATQCVPYARSVSGINIYGDAYTWWRKATPHYRRGHRPETGAVLVLASDGKMRHGHLAVVKNVVSPRLIDVTHSNWGNDSKSRRITYHSMRAEDVSPQNDWSSIRFWNYKAGSYGFPYKALGFIYAS